MIDAPPRPETCSVCGRVLLWAAGELVCVMCRSPEYGKPQDRAGERGGERR